MDDILHTHTASTVLDSDVSCCHESSKRRIAIIGYSCRLPGNVSSPTELWELCTRKRSGWSPIPRDRFASDAFHHPNPSRVGSFNPAGGYFLQDDISRFDAPFFNITAQEAISMDPQQRLLLECSYEAIESAGIPKESLAGRNVGVFVGGNFADYELHNVRDVETIPMYQATGCAPSLQSNRISYYFDFRGPSFTVDTACSSSLVALHAAVQSLRSGESTEALVAGCRLNIVPDLFISMSMSQLFNDEGKTYAFDNRATSGFARGEGAGVVLLKSLEDAIRDQDPIRAVIVNSGVSQDGRTQGITLPNGLAQEELIRRVYSEAHIDPEQCGFVEMHGTGTKVGDPIEATAVHAALGNGRSPRNPLYIGSVKSNIGHLEGASGVISLIKAAMMLDHGLLLPNADFKKANDNIPLDEWNMKVVTSTRPWPRGKRFISVSNYGFGGTNAHVVLEKAPLNLNSPDASSNGTNNNVHDTYDDPRHKLIFISANDKESLRQRIKDFGIYFEQRPEVFEKLLFGNFAFTVGSKLSHLSYRVALPARSLDDLGIRLAQLKVNASKVLSEPKIAYVFTGQGAQWAQMGCDLMEKYPVFAAAIQQADECLREWHAEWSLKEEIQKDPAASQIDSPELSQPACTAIQIALVTLLESWGMYPSSVVGHSSGEIAASFAAGIYDLKSAMALSYHRGQMTRILKETYPSLRGGMIAVGAGIDTVRPVLKMLRTGYATVACVNSPTSVTVSGDLPAIDELEGVLQKKQLFNRRLKIDVAYHSDHMKKISEDYLASIADIQPSPTLRGHVVFASSVLGRIAYASTLNSAYWVQNLTSPVLFPDALEKICKHEGEHPNLLIEIGPHSALKGPIGDTLKHLGLAGPKVAYAPTIVRKVNAVESVLNAAAAAYVRGANLDPYEINFPCSGAKHHSFLTDLPRYPWQHTTRYWHEPRIVKKHQIRDGPRNDILGVMANYSNDMEPTWRNIVRLDDIPWLRDHKMQGMVVYPLAGYLSMALEAAARRAQQRNSTFAVFELREIVVGSALVLSDDVDVETTISLRPYDEGTRGVSDLWDEFKIHSWNSQRGWIQHCHGLIGVRNSLHCETSQNFGSHTTTRSYIHNQQSKIFSSSTNMISTDHLYQFLTELGADYGPTFKGLENCFADSHHSYADLYVRDTASLMPKGFQSSLILHPAFLDGLLHLVWPILGHGRMELDTLYMPTLVKHAIICRDIPSTSGQHVKALGTGSPNLSSPEPTQFDLFATTEENAADPLISLEGLVMTPIRDAGIGAGDYLRRLCYKLEWQPWVKPSDLTNGHAHPDKIFNGGTDLLRNGYAYVDGQINLDGLNGLTGRLTNGVNGRHHVNGYASTAEETQGVSIEQALQKRHCLIVRFTRHVEIEPTVSEFIKDLGQTPSETFLVSDLENSQCNERQVIILQSPDASLREVTAAEFDAIRSVLLNAAKILWVYPNISPDAQMTVGMTRSVRSETMAKIVTLGLDREDLIIASNTILTVMEAIWPNGPTEPCRESEFRSSDSQLFVLRAMEDFSSNTFVHNENSEMTLSTQPFTQAGRRFRLAIAQPGSLDTIYFADENISELKDNCVEIEVQATGINFKDVVVSMGQLDQPYIGVECSGIIRSVGKNVTDIFPGQRVMAIPEGAYSTYARCPNTSVAPIPETMSIEEAATIPIIFCTAYYGLFDVGRLCAGERVLIHAGAGGVGQAAIQLAQMAGADIYVTVGSHDKKTFLMQHYSIPENRIFYSRDNSFGPAIRRATDNEGVDVVLNSLAGDLLRESWDCVAPFGRFIEIGKADITKNSRLEMLKFEYNVTFASVDLTKVAKFRPKLMKRLLNDICRLLEERTIKPIYPISKYSISEVEVGFRTLQTGRNIGKSVVVPSPDDQVKAVSLKTSDTILRSDATYLIIGGTGGLGRSMTKWMSNKGAKNIVLISRSGFVTDKLKTLIHELGFHGTKILVKACDVSSRADIDKLLMGELIHFPPVRGVLHGAMILRDTLFENMTLEDFRVVSACKVEGAWNLHHCLKQSPLDFFIALSSVAGVVGNRGQAAYSAANVFLDGFMEYRRSQGLPGRSIDLAAITEVGYLADSDPSRQQEVVKNIGGATVNESEVLALLALAITSDLNKSSQCQFITGLEVTDSLDNFWLHDSKFSFIREAAESVLSESQKDGKEMSLRVAVQSTSSREDAIHICYEALVTKLATVLSMNPEDMDTSTRVSSLGLDSLVAIEIRNWIAREAHANVQVLELLSSESLIKLGGLILTKSKLPLRF
ncbi:polyketide synthase, putative [Talaromyces stipitatus ATCC 10500]|uniref:Polyketide synthase, putative n=1 Tax=Talaromyces stipitatus (strain ATCC 10500 / CBS 375.48 / QM 6759 / NRRL 1006) TaxID=441959 RepID=B8LWY1_TALSN|nr:polyketide synthase, putative [Talaromyces stipitatus ATCC 10500]EED24614.1 polyketide synthase, putative [Talaromyces stipitatus ATCC 10500]